MVPLPSMAAASAEEVQEQQNPWLAYTLLPLASVAQPQVGLALRAPSSQVELPNLAPVRMTAWVRRSCSLCLTLTVGCGWRRFACTPRLIPCIAGCTVCAEEGVQGHLGGVEVVGLLVCQRVRCVDGALGDRHVDGLSQVPALTGGVCCIVACAWAAIAPTALQHIHSAACCAPYPQ